MEQEKKVELLMKYLNQLEQLNRTGYQCNIEIKEAIDALRYELGITESYQSVPQVINLEINMCDGNKCDADLFAKKFIDHVKKNGIKSTWKV